MGLVTVNFHLETDMQVASKAGTFLQNLGMLGLWVLKLFAMYVTDGQTKATLIVQFPTGMGIITITTFSIFL